MSRFSLKDHFTWMIIAGVVVAANGVIQTVGGTQPLGLASLAVGALLIALGFARPRAMSRDRSPMPAPAARAGEAAPSRSIRAIGLLLVISALVIAVVAGLPAYFLDGAAMPTAATVVLWAALAFGVALLAFNWQRHRSSGRRPIALTLGVFLGLLTVSAATTSIVRSGVVTLWKATHPAQQMLLYGLDPGFDHAPRGELLAASRRSLSNLLEASGEFHEPRRVGDENIAVLIATTDAAAVDELSDLITSGYLGFHLVHDDSDSFAISAAGSEPPDGYRLIGAGDGNVLIKSAPELIGAAITNQTVSSGATGDTVVDVVFDEAGRAALEATTTANVGRRLAIVSGDRVLSAPTIREGITGGIVQISGNFTSNEAFRIVRALYLGGLPAPLVLVSQEIIDQ